MHTDILAWLILRIAYAWMFLYPVKNLLRDWSGTKKMVALVTPCAVNFSAVMMILVMIAGSLSILFGFFAQVGGLLLCIYSLAGARVHYKLAKLAALQRTPATEKLVELAMLGNITSAEKNFVLAAMGVFFLLMGAGPLSFTPSFYITYM